MRWQRRGTSRRHRFSVHWHLGCASEKRCRRPDRADAHRDSATALQVVLGRCAKQAVNRSRRRSRMPAVLCGRSAAKTQVRSTKEGPPESNRITTTATTTEHEWRGLHRRAPRAGDAISRERESWKHAKQQASWPSASWSFCAPTSSSNSCLSLPFVGVRIPRGYRSVTLFIYAMSYVQYGHPVGVRAMREAFSQTLRNPRDLYLRDRRYCDGVMLNAARKVRYRYASVRKPTMGARSAMA